MKKQEDGPARGTWHIYTRGIEERLFNRLFITRKFLYHLVEHLWKPARKGRPPARRQRSQALQCQSKNDPVKDKCPCPGADTLVTAMPHWPCPVKPTRRLRKLTGMKDEQPPHVKMAMANPSSEQGSSDLHTMQCTPAQTCKAAHYSYSTKQSCEAVVA